MISNLNIYDPFTNCYVTRNLDPDFWWEAQHNVGILELVDQVKEIVKDGNMWANIQMNFLWDFEFQVWVSCAPRYYHRIQAAIDGEKSKDPAHWAALCIAMLSHTSMEVGERVYRFQRSLGDTLLIGDAITTEIGPGNRSYKYPKNSPRPKELDRLLGVKPPKETKNEPQLSLF